MLYDLANTTFALGVGSRYFGLWLIEERGGSDWHLSLATIVAMVAVILLGPWVGALSDRSGRRIPYLVGSTIVCVAATALLATWGVVPSLVLYAIGTVAFNTGTVVYDALLPVVSTPETRGRVSGLGVAVGYIGSVLAIAVGALLLESFGYATVFRALALAFLVFALPAFLFIPERGHARDGSPAPGLAGSPALLVRAWREAARHKGVVPFLVGRFLYTDAINTVFLFNAVYAKLEIGFTDAETDRLALLGIGFAILGAAAAGRLVDAIGPRRVLLIALSLQFVCLAAEVLAGTLPAPGLGWLAGATGGAGVGAAWAADRVFLLRLAPAELVGQFFGLYAAVGRFATVTGPLVWALATDGLGWSRAAALALLGVLTVTAGMVIVRVRDVPRVPVPA